MFFATVVRSAAAARSAVRPLAQNAPRRLAAVASPRAPSFAPRAIAWTALRSYSASAGLSQEEVYSRIKQLLSTFDKVNDPTNITEKAHFANDLGLDSLDTVEVVMAIEEEFSIEIPDKDADTIHSIDKAVDYIVSQPDAN